LGGLCDEYSLAHRHAATPDATGLRAGERYCVGHAFDIEAEQSAGDYRSAECSNATCADPTPCISVGTDMGCGGDTQAGLVGSDERGQHVMTGGAGELSQGEGPRGEHGIGLEFCAEVRVLHFTVVGKGTVCKSCLRATDFHAGAPDHGLRRARNTADVTNDHASEIRS